MTREEFLKQKIAEHGTMKEFAQKINMPYTTLFSILKNVGGASIDNILKICAGLNIKADTLNNLPLSTNNSIQLNKKDYKTIANDLEKMMNDLSDESFAAYGGTVDDEHEKELLRSALKTAMEIAKLQAKKKFTPNKYKK